MSSCWIDLTGSGVPEVNRLCLWLALWREERRAATKGPIPLDACHMNAKAQMHYPRSPKEETRGKCNFAKVTRQVDLARIHPILPLPLPQHVREHVQRSGAHVQLCNTGSNPTSDTYQSVILGQLRDLYSSVFSPGKIGIIIVSTSQSCDKD